MISLTATWRMMTGKGDVIKIVVTKKSEAIVQKKEDKYYRVESEDKF